MHRAFRAAIVVSFSMNVAGSSVKNPAVVLHSISKLKNLPDAQKFKILHFVRHAEGTHNVNSDYRNPSNIDAKLTERGLQQCRVLASKIDACARYDGERDRASFDGAAVHPSLKNVQSVVVSPMTRTLQTARNSFPDFYASDVVPFLACEDWRETCNYLCDKRRTVDLLRTEFRGVDFRRVREEDPLWAKYEALFGPHDGDHTSHRESDDDRGLEARARRAWRFLADRPETNLVVVSHQAFMRHVFNPDFSEVSRRVVRYGDDEARAHMATAFENCEMRTVVAEM